jgi:hypothetical protein
MTYTQHKTLYNDTCKAPEKVNDINPFRVSAHGAKENRYVNGRHVRPVIWSVMGHLRALDVLFDEMVDHLLCAAKDETSVDIMGRMFCCNFLRESRL